MATTRAKILVKRYNPETAPGDSSPGEAKPYLAHFELHFEEVEQLTVLDALTILKDTQDGSLSFRWSCRMGICGSCSAVVNGKPVLMCQTYLKDCTGPSGEVRVEPLRNFPVVKDLVVDIDEPMEKFRTVMPYMKRAQEKAINEGEYMQTPRQRKALEQTSQCIKCMLCYSACPVYAEDKNFLGPAAAALAMRYQSDSRDQGKKERLDAVIGEKGVWKCSFVGECSAVCPKRVDPALSLQRLKLSGAFRLATAIAGQAEKALKAPLQKKEKSPA